LTNISQEPKPAAFSVKHIPTIIIHSVAFSGCVLDTYPGLETDTYKTSPGEAAVSQNTCEIPPVITFPVVEEAKTIDELNKKEIIWISICNSTNRNIGYNIETGGKNAPCPESTKKVLRIKNLGKRPTNAKLNDDLINQIRNDYITGKFLQTVLAKKYNIGTKLISRVLSNEYYYDEKYIIPQIDKKTLIKLYANCIHYKLSFEIAKCIRKEFLTNNFSYKQLSEKYNISESLIRKIIKNKCWKE